MRKYAIPKIAYILLAIVLTCLSIGGTYAYFSAKYTANSNVTLGKISIAWKDFTKDAYIPSLFDDVNAIAIDSTTPLKRGEYTSIKALLPKDNEEDADKFIDLSLAMSNVDATVGAYCRIEIVAKYIINNTETEQDCNAGDVQLALNSSLITKIQVNEVTGESYEFGWFEDNGYYYYGNATKDADGNITSATLKELTSGATTLIANQLYLSPNANADMLDSSMTIMLTLEGVQTTNEAYKSVWEVDW